MKVLYKIFASNNLILTFSFLTNSYRLNSDFDLDFDSIAWYVHHLLALISTSTFLNHCSLPWTPTYTSSVLSIYFTMDDDDRHHIPCHDNWWFLIVCPNHDVMIVLLYKHIHIHIHIIIFIISLASSCTWIKLLVLLLVPLLVSSISFFHCCITVSLT